MDSATVVNGQITDAVTQANTKVPGTSPAVAIGDFYQSISHALGIAANNAASAQQQHSVLLEAATTQCIVTILSADQTAAASPEKISTGLGSSVSAISDAGANHSINEQVEAAIKLSLKSVLGSGSDVGFAMRTVMDAFNTSIAGITRNQYTASLESVKLALLTSIFMAMIKSPEHEAAYEKVLEKIKAI